MDAKGFFLGLIAAVLLYALWKKEQGQSIFPAVAPAAPANGAGAPGCSGCGMGSPAAAAAPAAQSAIALVAGAGGQISPGTPPLDTAAGSGSFYGSTGPTPDSGFIRATNDPVLVSQRFLGSPTTSPTAPPVKSLAPVPPYSQQGFVARTNVAGVFTSNLRQAGYIQ